MKKNSFCFIDYVVISFFFLFFAACNKSGDTPSGGVNVYVAGMLNNKAVLWKNGVAKPLKLSTGTTISQALGMTITGSDIYIAGIQIDANRVVRPTYWKNGNPVLLSNSSESMDAYAIAVVGNDVYVAGNKRAANGYNISMYWKNGEMTVLNDSTKCDYEAFAIAVSGSDVYVGGRGFDSEGRIIYWKNGTPVRSSGNPGIYESEILNAFTSGSDVYLMGSINSYSPVYWKNDTLTYVPRDTITYAIDYISSMAISGSDVYALGNGLITAYWKNNTPVVLSKTDGNDPVSIAVYGSDVYVAATEQHGNFARAKYWKNGEQVYLTDGSDNNVQVRAIAVSKY